LVRTCWILWKLDQNAVLIQHQQIIHNYLEVFLKLLSVGFFRTWCHTAEDEVFGTIPRLSR
jgi:hypothetical protein